MIVLVTGGTGFLGGRLIEKLVLDRGDTVRVLLRSTGTASRIASLPVAFHSGDVTDAAAFRAAAQGCDIVLHCASFIEGGVPAKQTTTCAGAATAASVCAELGIPLVHVSSSAVYGNPDANDIDETTPQRPRHGKDVYGLAKIEAERAVRAACANGLKAAIIQPTMIYGPYSGEWTLAPFAMLAAADIVMPEGDASICNAVYVDDVVDAILLAIPKCSTDCPAWLINGPELPSWTDFLTRHAALGTPGKVVPTPRAEIDALQAQGGGNRSLIGAGMKILRENPDARSAILKTGLVGGFFRAFERLVPKASFDKVKGKLTGRKPNGIPSFAFPADGALPLALPYPHFLELATQQYRFSNAKAERELGYVPAWPLDPAFATIGAWAAWSRLVAP